MYNTRYFIQSYLRNIDLCQIKLIQFSVTYNVCNLHYIFTFFIILSELNRNFKTKFKTNFNESPGICIYFYSTCKISLNILFRTYGIFHKAKKVVKKYYTVHYTTHYTIHRKFIKKKSWNKLKSKAKALSTNLSWICGSSLIT